MVTGIYHQNIHLISQFPLPCLPSLNIQSVKVRTDQHIYISKSIIRVIKSTFTRCQDDRRTMAKTKNGSAKKD